MASKAKKLKDFDKMAMVEPTLSYEIFEPKVSDDKESQTGITMDSTAITEFSMVRNHQYSHQIIGEIRGKFKFEKLKKLKEKKNPEKYLEEARNQIDEVCSGMEALETHSNLFNVSFLIATGTILNDVEEYFKKKQKRGSKKNYMTWVRDNFGDERMRYFQHAKQLASMGQFALDYAALGKNRLLEFDRLRKKLKKPLKTLLTDHSFIDLTQDMNGELFKEHVDSIITYYRLTDTGIDFVEFKQASLIAAMYHKSITVKMAKDIKAWLDLFENQEKMKVAFYHFLLNKLAYPYNNDESERSPEKTKDSLNRLLGKVLSFNNAENLGSEDWINSQKDKIEPDIIIQALEFIVSLADKFSITIEFANQEDNKTNKKERKND